MSLEVHVYCRTRIELPVALARACDTARRAQLCARSDTPGLSPACPAGRPIDFRRAFELTMRVSVTHYDANNSTTSCISPRKASAEQQCIVQRPPQLAAKDKRGQFCITEDRPAICTSYQQAHCFSLCILLGS